MRNIMAADLFRLKMQKSTWILPLVTFIVLFLFGCIKGFLLGNASWLKLFHDAINGGISAIEQQAGVGSLDGFSSILGGNYPNLASYITSTFQRDSITIMVIFVSVYVAAVRRNGFVKNIGSVYNTFKYNVSQAIVLLGYSLLIMVVNLCAVMLSTAIFFENMEFGNVGSFVMYFIIVAVLHWVESLMVVLMCDYFKSPTTGIIIGCLYTGAVASFLCSVVNLVLEVAAKTDFRLNHIMPYGFSLIMRYDSLPSYLYGIALSAIYLLVFFGGKALIKRKDIA